MKTVRGVWITLLLLLVAACGEATETGGGAAAGGALEARPSDEAAKAADALPAPEEASVGVMAAHDAALEALVQGDTAALAACYAEDAELVMFPYTITRGEAAIFKFWDVSIRDGDFTGATLETSGEPEIVVSGELATWRGTVQVTQADGVRYRMDLSCTFRRIDGAWKRRLDVWSFPPMGAS